MHEQYLFNPKSIAVIGASEFKEKVGYALMDNLKEFKGKVIPINPNHKSLFNLPCYPTVLKYNQTIDLAIIAIPSKFVKQALIDCGKKSIKTVIIISAGYSEQGKIKEEQELVQIAKRYNMRILGPNCFGIVNPYLNLDTTFSKSHVNKGDIAFISQSGALWSYIADLAENRFGFSKFASLGNMADIEFSDLITYLNNDSKTKSIILYMERLKQGRRFIEVCKKSKKPIYVVKAGSSLKGGEATISHTGSLATNYEIYKGAFKQANITLCKSVVQALEIISKQHLIKRKTKKLTLNEPTSIITNAGGAGALVADYLSNKNYKVNAPNDILGTARAKDYLNALNKLKNKKDSIVIVLTPQTMAQPLETAETIIKFQKQTKKQIISCFLGARTIKPTNKLFKENKIPFFNTLEDLRRAL